MGTFFILAGIAVVILIILFVVLFPLINIFSTG
jgi:hypothetical protein